MVKFQIKNPPHKETLLKFCLLLGVFIAYFGYLSFKFDLATGGLLAVLTWSFFVLCTPVADAGFLLDFPIRLLFGLRMIFTEMMVWGIAFSVNIYSVFFKPHVYDNTLLTKVFYTILTTPNPYWSLIVLCALGTFLSIYFGDEMMDVVAHKDRSKLHSHGFRYQVILVVTLFTAIFFVYKMLIEDMGLTQYLS